MAPLADASAVTLTEFISQNVEPGSTVITDGWSAYPAITGHGYAHKPVNQKAARAAGADPGELLPAVHRVASLCKRWLLGTHQGSVDEAHLPAYLNEFAFRFNRRNASARGLLFHRLLQQAVNTDPHPYHELTADTIDQWLWD